MMVLVSYDVAQDDGGIKRLRKVAKICQNYGQRVQNSVFECLVDPAQWVTLKNELESVIIPEYDSLRTPSVHFYVEIQVVIIKRFKYYAPGFENGPRKGRFIYISKKESLFKCTKNLVR